MSNEIRLNIAGIKEKDLGTKNFIPYKCDVSFLQEIKNVSNLIKEKI